MAIILAAVSLSKSCNCDVPVSTGMFYFQDMNQALSRRRMSVALYAALVSFLTYASFFAFRKPFTILDFEGQSFIGMGYQTLLIVSQVLGYMCSKFFGIRYIAELKRAGRWKAMLLLISISWLSLLGLVYLPAPWGMLCMFINGFPLGLLWGIVFSYVEGRTTTDFISSVLAVSFIFSSGFVKSVGQWLMNQYDVPALWMPFAVGALFALPLLLFVYLMERIPPPDEQDERERTVRQPMHAAQREAFFRMFRVGLIAVVITYVLLTILRDIRDNFMANIWKELGYAEQASLFTRTEIPSTLFILACMSLLVLVRNNWLAFRWIHAMVACGFLLAGISSWLFLSGMIAAIAWVTWIGIGLYMAYIPFNSIFFDRLIATFRVQGNVGFLIYIADAFGYLGSISVMIAKEYLELPLLWSRVFPQLIVWLSIACLGGTLISFLFFRGKHHAGITGNSQ